VLSLLVVLVICFLIGLAVRTRIGFALRNRLEKSFFERMPGYSLIRSLTQRLAGEDREAAWKPALVEVEEALVPAFIIEELGDGRFTVFAVDSDAAGGSGVYLDGGASTSAGRAVRAGDQSDFAVGIGLEGSGSCNAEGRKCVGPKRLSKSRERLSFGGNIVAPICLNLPILIPTRVTASSYLVLAS
jgi:Protein of unknown function (DUF502)